LLSVAGAVCGALYLFFIRPNYSPELRVFWAASDGAGLSRGLLAALLFAAFAFLAPLFRLRRGVSPQLQMEIVAALPCLLLAAAAALGWYPSSTRTRLFVLPCFVLLATIWGARAAGWVASRRGALGPWMERAAILAAAMVAVAGMWREVRQSRDLPYENVEEAMHYLRRNVAPSNLLLVHPSNREGFRLYAAMDGWSGPQPLFGDTGWPCCPRGKSAPPGSSREADVVRDLNALIPRGYRGRVWLYYTTRPTHWDYTGLEEGDLWRRHLWENGCEPGQYVAPMNLAISPIDCRGYRVR
jgi:hypothetical protein